MIYEQLFHKVLPGAEMRERRPRQTLKLRVVALLLAVALSWYSLNPPLGFIQKSSHAIEPPDEKRREVQPQRSEGRFSLGGYGTEWPDPSIFDRPKAEDPDDFEWPEFIDG